MKRFVVLAVVLLAFAFAFAPDLRAATAPASAHILAQRVNCTGRGFDIWAIPDTDWLTFNPQKDAAYQFYATVDNGLVDKSGVIVAAKLDALIADQKAAAVTAAKQQVVDAAIAVELANRIAAAGDLTAKTSAEVVTAVFGSAMGVPK